MRRELIQQAGVKARRRPVAVAPGDHGVTQSSLPQVRRTNEGEGRWRAAVRADARGRADVVLGGDGEGPRLRWISGREGSGNARAGVTARRSCIGRTDVAAGAAATRATGGAAATIVCATAAASLTTAAAGSAAGARACGAGRAAARSRGAGHPRAARRPGTAAAGA